jgi:mono/diheme cytochrome c family protein
MLLPLILGACQGARQPAVALPTELAAGARLYQQHCQSCHGPEAVGTDLGPPLIDAMYAPGRTDDAAFRAAVQFGLKAKNWELGDMPASAGVTSVDMDKILPYVRYLQRTAAGATAPPTAPDH